MPGAGAASRGERPVTGAGAAARGGAGASQSGAKKKKVKGVLGPVDQVIDKGAGGLMNVVVSALSAPQQVVFKGAQAANLALHGEGDAALKAAKGAVGETFGAGLAGGRDIGFNEVLGKYDPETDQVVPKKLPTGVNTAANVVLDPLNFLTFGAGAGAKSATTTATKVLGKDAAERLAAQGVKKGLTEAEQATLRSALLADAEEAGAKNAAKTADRQMRELALRGRGGVTARIPGTQIGGTVISGETISKAPGAAAGRAARDAVKASGPGKFLRRGLVPGASVADAVGSQRAADDLLDVIKREQHGEANDVEDLLTRWDAAVRDFGGEKAYKNSGADSLVSRALQSGDLDAAKAANPELARLIDTGAAIRAASDEGLRASGALADGQGFDIDSFLHRTRTPEAAKALDGADDGVLREGRSLSRGMNAGSTKSRVIAPDSADYEVNDAIRRIQNGEAVPDDLLRDFGRVAEYQAPIREKIAALEAEKDAILQRNLEPRSGELTLGQQRKLAADAERLRRMDAEIRRLAAASDQIAASGERARGAVQAAGDTRLGRIIGDTRERLEETGQLERGRAARQKQLSIANRRVAKSEAVTKGQADTAGKLTGEAERRAESALQRAVREREAHAAAAADRVERFRNQATARLVKQDEKELGRIVDRVQGFTDQLAEKAKLAEDDTRALVEDIAQKLPPGTPLYRESAVASLVDSGVDAARAVHSAQMVNGVRAIRDDAGRAIMLSDEDVKLGAKVPEGWVKFDIPKLGTFHAPPAVKAELGQVMSIVGQDDIVKQATKWLKSWDRWWRGQVTASLPGGVPFGSRNARSNVMLTFVDGMSPKYFAKGGAFQLRVRSVIKNQAADIADLGVEAAMRKHLGERDFKIWKTARDSGVIGDGFYNIDLEDAPQVRATGRAKEGSKLRRGVRFVAGSHGTLAVKGRQFNQAIEQHARMSHFLYGIDRFGNLEHAAARTNTVLFDYGRRTPFEQKMIKTIQPFWTFMRKNLPGQVRGLIENPIRVTLPEKLSKAVSEPLPEDSPEYQKRSGAHISKIPGIAGLVTTPERPFQAAVNSLEPIAQLAGALLPGNQGPIEPEQGTPQALRSFGAQFGGGPLAMSKFVLEEGTGKSSFTGGTLNDEERRQRFLKAAYPTLGRAPVLTGRLPSAVAEQSTKNKAKQKTLAQIAQMLGIKLEEPR